MSPEDTVRAIHEQGGLAVIPHPYDIFRRSVLTDEAIERVKTHVDAIEGFNCRNILARARRQGARPRAQASTSRRPWARTRTRPGSWAAPAWRWTTSRRRRSCSQSLRGGRDRRPPLAADGALDQHLREDPLAPRPQADLRLAAAGPRTRAACRYARTLRHDRQPRRPDLRRRHHAAELHRRDRRPAASTPRSRSSSAATPQRRRHRARPARRHPGRGRRAPRLRDDEAFSDAITAVLDALRRRPRAPGRASCSSYLFPERYKGRVLNIHPALLPKYGGQGMYGHHVHEAVLAAGETESGCTVHIADHEYDHGPIVLQKRGAGAAGRHAGHAGRARLRGGVRGLSGGGAAVRGGTPAGRQVAFRRFP